ncbi:alpha/beta fold hydrolase [Rhizobacter sp. LjRoot28]|uniref:alpha/beta fold hydrolase n=1 Tax=Rhizobacter sp. LjRoot28 TaxID=3342309 RepID=UPI003ECEBD33
MPRHQTLSFGFDDARMAVALAGDRTKPALLLLHGFPSSSATFHRVIAPLARDCFVIALDLPGFGSSEPLTVPSFARYADGIERLLAALGVHAFFLYLHDFGAAVGCHLLTRAPARIRGLIIQNANAHESGLGPAWAATRAYWADPSPEREAAATAHLTAEGTRAQYVDGVPEDITGRISPRRWEDDWRVMSMPGRLATQRALVLDYLNHVARFTQIAECLQRSQPPALMLWGRHDPFFALEETLSWLADLPRMEAHVLDGPHFLLETHAPVCVRLMRDFIRNRDEERT